MFFDPPEPFPEWDLCQLLPNTYDGFPEIENQEAVVIEFKKLPLTANHTDPPYLKHADPPYLEHYEVYSDQSQLNQESYCDPPHGDDFIDPPHEFE